jgi:formylmethanofuran dehydrogenase subunit E-like metal-binding protein
MSSTVRRSSILQTNRHSSAVSETDVVVAWSVNTGTSRVEGMRFDSTCHSSMRRAASISRLVFDFWMVAPGLSSPAWNVKSPSGQIASS